MTNHKCDESLPTEEAQEICAADRGLIQAESSRNLELVMSYIAHNAVLLPPGQPAVVGYDAVREFYASWFAIPYTTIQVHEQTVSMAASRDVAYLVGESSLVLSGSQEERQVPAKYLGVWRKFDGEWRLAAISWSANEVSADT